jgi:hypothetical protein
VSLATLLEQLDHGLAHPLAHVHVRLGVAAVVAAGAAAHGQRVRVHGGDVALVPRVLAGLAVHREHGVEDEPVEPGRIHFGLAQRRGDELGIGGVELLAQRVDELDEVDLVAPGQRRVARVAVALPPQEPGDLVPRARMFRL